MTYASILPPEQNQDFNYCAGYCSQRTQMVQELSPLILKFTMKCCGRSAIYKHTRKGNFFIIYIPSLYPRASGSKIFGLIPQHPYVFVKAHPSREPNFRTATNKWGKKIFLVKQNKANRHGPISTDFRAQEHLTFVIQL